MTQLNQVYKCEVCGNIVQVLHTGRGQLVCCGKPMVLQQEKLQDAGYEKHVPVVEASPGSVTVRVGSVPHPMEDKHFIEWIELESDGVVQRKFLQPGNAPSATFCATGDKVNVRAYCNIHGLWQATK
ncbi:MAG: desulfoferrodoxin [Bacillota bacterium]